MREETTVDGTVRFSYHWEAVGGEGRNSPGDLIDDLLGIVSIGCVPSDSHRLLSRGEGLSLGRDRRGTKPLSRVDDP